MTRSRHRPTSSHVLTTAVLLLPVVLAAIGCAARRQPTAEESYSSASEYFDSGAYEVAVQEYKQLLDQHPFSEHVEEAEIKIAQSYYLMGRYAEAVAAFSDFERMHPMSPETPMVTYYLGMSYLQQMRPPDRDQAASESAYGYFRAVLDRYPESEWAARAGLRLRECEESIAAHELYVARFYLRHRNLPAAEGRLARILVSYPDTESAADALLAFGEAYEKRGLDESARLAFEGVLVHHPEVPAATIARRRLGVLPGENDGLADDPDPIQQLLAKRLPRPEAETPDATLVPVSALPSLATDGRGAGRASGADPAGDVSTPY
jgi:outer membrane protein assembly factor BamD